MSDRVAIEETPPPPVPLWLLTYTDTISLLVCFFVMLIGFSSMEKEENSTAPGMLSGYSGVNSGSRYGNDSIVSSMMGGGETYLSGYEIPPDYDPLSYTQEQLEVAAKRAAIANSLALKLTRNGFEIKILAGSSFERDMTVLKPEANEIIAIVASACKNIPHQVRVQAFSDDIFIPSERFSNSSQLALARSVQVCQALNQKGIALERISTGIELDQQDPIKNTGGEVMITILRSER